MGVTSWRCLRVAEPVKQWRKGLMHPDRRSGRDERSSQRSDELLSVPEEWIRHHIQHARKAHWQTPFSGAPHLLERSPCGDPQTLRARRPLIMTMRLPCKLSGSGQGWALIKH